MKVEVSKKEQLFSTDIKIKEINENTQPPNDLTKYVTSSMVLSIKASQMDPKTKIDVILKSLSDENLDLTEYTQKFMEEKCRNLQVLIESQFSLDDLTRLFGMKLAPAKRLFNFYHK